MSFENGINHKKKALHARTRQIIGCPYRCLSALICHVLSATIHPDLKLTLVAMSDRTGMSASQVTDEVLYTGLVEMQELPELDE